MNTRVAPGRVRPVLSVRQREGSASKAAGVGRHQPDLRGSFCPLLLAADVNLAEIADEAGNSVEVLSSNYLGVINELRGRALVDAEGAIQFSCNYTVSSVRRTPPSKSPESP